jgi:hypothetical protein
LALVTSVSRKLQVKRRNKLDNSTNIPGSFVDLLRRPDHMRLKVCAVPLTRARADTSNDHDPLAIAKRVYTDEFLSALYEKFKFNALNRPR